MKYSQNNLFILYVVSVFYIYIIRTVFPSTLLNFADDFIFLLMLANVLVFSRDKKLYFELLSFLVASIILIYFIYGLVNENDLFAPIMYLRYFKNFFIILIIASLGNKCFEKTMRLVYYGLIISIPISFYQFKTADMSSTSWWDEVGGILGRDGNSGTLSLLILTYVAYEYFKRLRDKKNVIGPYIFLMLPMLINETKIVIFLMPFIFILVSIVYGTTTLKKVVFIVPLFFFSGLLVNSAYMNFFGYSMFDTIDYEFIENYFFIDEAFSAQEIDIGRFMRLIYADAYLTNQGELIRLFGEGLGSAFYGQNSGIEGKLVSEFFVLRLHTGSRNQLYQMLLEFGYVGTLLFISLLIFSWVNVVKSSTRTDEETLAIITVPVFLFSLAYQPVIESKAIVFLMCYSLALAKYNKATRI